MKNPENQKPASSLSPVSRRAFLISTPAAAAAGAAALTGCGGGGGGGYGNCYYCNDVGQNYYTCDGFFYCDYFDYPDF